MFRFFLAAGTWILPAMALAQPVRPNGFQLIPESGQLGATCNFITGEFHYECFPIYLAYLIQVVFAFATGTCMFEILRGGYEWSFAGLGGDTQGARKRIQNAVIGLVVSVLAFLIVDTIVINLLSGPSNL